VIERDGRLDFDSMQMRLHPAESRIRKLSAEIPAQFIAFDVLLWGDKPVHESPLEERRAVLENLPFTISPASTNPAQAEAWLEQLDAAGLDGVICKRLGLPYLPGSREGVVKVKTHKSADCVVVGVRWKARPTALATLLLGLYSEQGTLGYVGSCAVAAGRHDEILKRLKPLMKGAPERGFSEPNRWGSGELVESAVRPELVVEVRYDKVQGNRFRHGTRLLRFRDDKDPKQCTWREVRPAPSANELTVPKLLSRKRRGAKRG
jgi:ATP-dependent DNA ligase